MILKCIEENGRKFIDRENLDNISYISECAAMSLHKAIIGISELKALEECMEQSVAGGFRLSRAINSYYVIYQILVASILLDTDFELSLKDLNLRKMMNDKFEVNMQVSNEILSSKSELPDDWNKAKESERDLSTSIGHSMLKKYCANLRTKKYQDFDKLKKIIFDNFVKVDFTNCNVSLSGLYEKACYVRDRAVYRPSVVYDEECQKYLTSLDVRYEIESLPKSKDYFEIMSSLLESIEVESLETGCKHKHFLLCILWNNNVSEDLTKKNIFGEYNDEDLKLISKSINKDENEISLPTYTSQHIELVNKSRLLSDLEYYWGSMEIDFQKYFLKYMEKYKSRTSSNTTIIEMPAWIFAKFVNTMLWVLYAKFVFMSRHFDNRGNVM